MIGKDRRGFTLVEAMIASSIFVLIVAGSLTMITGLTRLIGQGYQTAELSIRMREIREKLLFHPMPPHDGKFYPGVLTGSPVSSLPIEGGIKIYVETPVTKNDGSIVKSGNGSIVYSKLQLVKSSQQANGGYSFRNDSESQEYYRTRWFSLGPVGYLGSDPLDDSLLSTDSRLTKNLYFVNLEASLGGVSRKERVAVPVFGYEQKKNATSVFHDAGGTP